MNAERGPSTFGSKSLSVENPSHPRRKLTNPNLNGRMGLATNVARIAKIGIRPTKALFGTVAV